MGTIKVKTGVGKPAPGAFLTAKQMRFVEEYVVDFNGTRAAIAAGYTPRNAAVQASLLLDPDRFPLVAARIGRLKAEKALRSKMSGDELLTRVCAGIAFEPCKFFERGESRQGVAGWLMSEEDLTRLPPEVGALVEETECRTIKKGDVEVRKMWVRFVSKLGLIQVAAKHLLSENVNLTHTLSPLEELTKRVDATGARVRALVEAPVPMQVEAKVVEVAVT